MKIIRSALLFVLILSVQNILFPAASGKYSPMNIDGGKAGNVIKKQRETSHYLPDRVVVKMINGSVSKGAKTVNSISGLQKISSRFGITSVEQFFSGLGSVALKADEQFSNYLVVKYSSPADAFSVAEEISKLPDVQYAEPWFIYPVNDVQTCRPNDPSRGSQWGLDKVMADTAWCNEQGDTNIVIGIIDTGVLWTHPDLQENIWINPGEWGDDGLGGRKESNGIDDDSNGKVDDYHGWDFGGANYLYPIEDNNPTPTSSSATHGTHVAGIASAVTNNGTGIAGIGYKCKILPVKAGSDNDTRATGGTPYIVFGMEGIVYAAMMGADIISLSWGGAGASQLEQEVIDIAMSYGAIVVAAAGNSADNSLQYPASYNGVISVAATLPNDVKPWYSTWNEYVDVAAPGDNIFSTVYGVTNIYSYDYMDGTSMSTPLVAGLIGLVKSHNPGITSFQAAEQVRVTCDNINSVNPNYVDLLGKGRINALKALTISSPSLRMISYLTDDSVGGNNNKILQPGETFSIITTIKNYLSPTNPGATITLSENDTYVSIVQGSYPVGVVNTMGEASNSTAPFRVTIAGNAPPAHSVRFKLTITDGSYSDFQYFWVLINPTFATHNVNNVEVSLSNISRIGFVDLNNVNGSGFVHGGWNQLYEGGLMIGYSATKLVDVVRNDTCGTCQDHDFSSQQVYNMLYPGSLSAQDGSTMFTDSLANPTNKIGLKVDMYSYAFTTADDSNYIILRYDITNRSGGVINDLYVGLFMDWDIVGPQTDYYLYNRTTYQTDMDMGYAWNSAYAGTSYCGVRALDGAGSYRGLINNASISLTRASKFNWLSGGFVTVDSVADIHFVISNAPFSLQDGEKKMVGFALLGAKNIDELWTTADAAKLKWTNLKKLLGADDLDAGVPPEFQLHQNYPNPFNPLTTIKYNIPKGSLVSLKIYDILGRLIAVLVDKDQEPGKYSIQFNASSLSSGTYYYKLTANGLSEIKKFLLLK